MFFDVQQKTTWPIPFCIIYSVFCVFFGLAYFTLNRNECYTVKSSNSPVDITLNPEANNTTAWFNLTLSIGFWSYLGAAVSSLGYLAKSGPLQAITSMTEKFSRYVIYAVFVCVHVMRFCHTGSVCSGDYLPKADRSDSIVQNYNIATGEFFLTYIILGWVAVPALLITVLCIKGDSWAALVLDAPK